MAGFEVVYSPHKPLWVPVDTTAGATTVYNGQLVVAGAIASCSGVKAWNPAGAGDTTVDQVPFGVVVGTDAMTPVFNSTYKAESITSVVTQSTQASRSYVSHEGMWSKGDPAAMVQVAVLSPEVVLKGRIFTTSYGTAIGVDAIATDNGDGLAFTCSALDHTPVAYNATVFARNGLNKGLYRITYDTSTTVKTVKNPFPYDFVAGDSIVGVNVSAFGTCKMMTDTAGTFIDNAAAVGTTNYIWIDVLELNLSEAGNEYAIFRINPLQFLALRA